MLTDTDAELSLGSLSGRVVSSSVAVVTAVPLPYARKATKTVYVPWGGKVGTEQSIVRLGVNVQLGSDHR
jgi:hypothetical protein